MGQETQAILTIRGGGGVRWEGGERGWEGEGRLKVKCSLF